MKKFISLIMCAVMLFAFAACNNCNGCKNNALDTAEFSNKSRRQISIFHLRFSLAYSVGVHPVIFLNEIPK